VTTENQSPPDVILKPIPSNSPIVVALRLLAGALAPIGDANGPHDDDGLTIKQVAALLSLQDRTIYRWTREGSGPKFHRLGSRIFFRRSAVCEFIAERALQPAPRKALGV
jgi:excisionase family DNA binding protein